jgi:thiol-disulfide isomerase/thioredoxin
MRIISFLALVWVAAACTKAPVEFKTGTWRGLIEMQGQQLPFTFEVAKKENNYIAYLRNDTERILLDEISLEGDSVTMVLHVFDAALKAKVEGNTLTGKFVKNYAPNATLPFSATWGEDYRFSKETTASVDYSGKYQVQFFTEKDTSVSVGIFAQKGNIATGTFLMLDGDYRYLEGNVVDNELKLSTFDGNHAYIFTAKKLGDTLRGHYYSGKTGYETWVAVKNENAKMPDAESLTYLKPGYEKLDFSFPDLNGNKISSADERFKGKVLILQILGTWCPNCMDETKFLKDWYVQNKDRGVEILGLAYERKDDFNYASERVKKMKDKWGVSYDFVIAGTNDKPKAAQTLPALNRVLAFPTTIFIGRDGKVKHIHTGFTGPGTGVYYDQFIERFNQIVNELLNDKIASKK